MKIINIFILFILSMNLAVFAQDITGTVYDKTTGEPVADAHVYLNGTSYFTTTSDSGTFHLKVTNKINTQFIISHLLYETMTIDAPYEKEISAVYLTVRRNILDQVVIKPAERYTNREKMAAFEVQLLGDNRAGKSCKILNKDDIQLIHDERQRTLFARCAGPIIVENEYLGYRVHVLLSDFQICYAHGRTLNKNDIVSFSLQSTNFFTDLSSKNNVIKKRRDEAYKISANYFFKSLAAKTIRRTNHIICNVNIFKTVNLKINNNNPERAYQIDPNQYFDITDHGLGKTVRIKPGTDINKNTDKMHLYPYPISGVITVFDPAGNRSEIVFLTEEFTVDSFGLIDKKDYVYVSGNMFNLRIGNMVPLDYE